MASRIVVRCGRVVRRQTPANNFHQRYVRADSRDGLASGLDGDHRIGMASRGLERIRKRDRRLHTSGLQTPARKTRSQSRRRRSSSTARDTCALDGRKPAASSCVKEKKTEAGGREGRAEGRSARALVCVGYGITISYAV